MAERCVCCGAIIPEGRQVCPNCEKKAKECDAIDFCGELCAFAEDIINRAKQKWIPVTERLPREEWEYFTEENDWDVYPCLAVVKTSRGGRYVTKMFYTGENFVDDEYVRYTAQVTHWMPLPEPPKGE